MNVYEQTIIYIWIPTYFWKLNLFAGIHPELYMYPSYAERIGEFLYG